MNFIDYREKLGIGFNDEEKFKYLKTIIFNVITPDSGYDTYFFMSAREYFDFCNLTGSELHSNLLGDSYRSHSTERFSDCVNILRDHSYVFSDFLLYYVSLANSLPAKNGNRCDRVFMRNLLTGKLEESRIPYEVMKVDDEFFVFPKGAKELDDALVSEPLEWLKDYPQARKTFCIALKQYADGQYIRDTADNFRKALETFLQEYLGNGKNLETNKAKLCNQLGQNGVNPEFCGLLQTLLNTYKNINDKYVKHNDAIDEKLLEFIMYQTGVFIRMIISVK
ncbi:hypothetical protein SAMN02910436_02185 [Ruminococcaceae bacterium P7]|nr:hypothetical protein SAMN02910436_02185 [Ruminococcaceae bacterium P7]